MTVPEWVHMADVPPPVDDDPWTVPAPEPDPARRWLALATIAVLVLAVALTVVWWGD